MIPVAILLAWSVAVLIKGRTLGSVLQLLGAACLLVVVLAHLCEALNLLPFMGWGAKGSIGHYVDLASAILGVALLTVGSLIYALSKRKAHAA